MKLTLSKINQMLGALNSLSGGRSRVIETNGQASGSVVESFTFPAQTKVNIIHNVGVLRPLAETYSEALKQITKDVSPDGTNAAIDADPALLRQYQKRHEELLESKLSAKGLLYINWETLETAKVDTNTVANLGKLVRGIPAPSDADLIKDEEV